MWVATSRASWSAGRRTKAFFWPSGRIRVLMCSASTLYKSLTALEICLLLARTSTRKTKVFSDYIKWDKKRDRRRCSRLSKPRLAGRDPDLCARKGQSQVSQCQERNLNKNWRHTSTIFIAVSVVRGHLTMEYLSRAASLGRDLRAYLGLRASLRVLGR